MSNRALILFICLGFFVGAAFSQTNQSSNADQKQAIRIGIAVTVNRSGRQIVPTWERDQLVRELKRLHSDRKSTMILEAVPLDAANREDAAPEAEKTSCEYFVLTTVLDPARGPGISGGPDGSQRAPVLLGNTSPRKTLAMNFELIEIASERTVAEGTTTAPVEGNNDVRAADDTMRFVAHRVATELRSQRPPKIN